jgi:hypothetical protein
MNTVTMTVSEYAELYGCTPQFVSRNLKKNTGMLGMVSWRKVEGRTGSWIIIVLKSWVDNKQNEQTK